MDWLGPIIGFVTGTMTSSPVWAPWLYRLLSGKVAADGKAKKDLVSQHERLETSMQVRLDTYRTQMDALIADVRKLERENGEQGGKIKILEIENQECTERCRELENRLSKLEK